MDAMSRAMAAPVRVCLLAASHAENLDALRKQHAGFQKVLPSHPKWMWIVRSSGHWYIYLRCRCYGGSDVHCSHLRNER